MAPGRPPEMGAGHAHALYVHEHSPVHALAPEAKVLAAVGFAASAAVLPREAVWGFALDAVVLLLAVRVARVPVTFVLARLLVIVPFVAFAFFLPFIATGERTVVLGIGMSRDGLWSAWGIIGKASLGAGASILLAATTEVPRILQGLERLRVPPTLTAIAAFAIRYLEIVSGELGRTRRAMAARGFRPRWLGEVGPIAHASGSLFVRSYERGERIHQAMLARGWTGRLPDREPQATSSDWAAALAPAIVAATVTIVAWSIR